MSMAKNTVMVIPFDKTLRNKKPPFRAVRFSAGARLKAKIPGLSFGFLLLRLLDETRDHGKHFLLQIDNITIRRFGGNGN